MKSAYEYVVPRAQRIIDEVVYATVTTVNGNGEPRSRIVHPVWRLPSNPGQALGIVTSRPTALTHKHLTSNANVSCSYWSPAHDAVYLDCRARSATQEELQSAWDLVLATTGPTAFDPEPIYREPSPASFSAILLQPFRIRVVEAVNLATAGPYPYWSSATIEHGVAHSLTDPVDGLRVGPAA
jgi:hypothetical protein